MEELASKRGHSLPSSPEPFPGFLSRTRHGVCETVNVGDSPWSWVDGAPWQRMAGDD